MKYYIHIGRPKTGTSSIQNSLTKNKNVLRSYGFHYILVKNINGFEPVNLNHIFNLVTRRNLKGKQSHEIKQLVDQVRKIILLASDEGLINIISSEALSNVDLDIFDSIFYGHEIKIFCYIRNELDFFASSYAQLIHANDIYLSIEKYLQRSKGKFSNLYFLNKYGLFYHERFIPNIFSKELLPDGCVVKDFYSKIVNLNHQLPVELIEDGNPSITDEVLAFKLLLVRENSNLLRHRKIYNALAVMSKTFGSKYKLPSKVKKVIYEDVTNHSYEWSAKFFSAKSIFNYDDYRFDDRSEIDIDVDDMNKHLVKLLDTANVF